VAGMPDILKVEVITPKAGRSRVQIDFTGDDDGVAAINRKLAQEDIMVYGFNEEIKDLEALFMGVTKGLVT